MDHQAEAKWKPVQNHLVYRAAFSMLMASKRGESFYTPMLDVLGLFDKLMDLHSPNFAQKGVKSGLEQGSG